MNRYLITRLIVPLALIGGWLMWSAFDRRESDLRSEQSRLLAAQQNSWGQQDFQRALAAEQKSLDFDRAYAQEISRALGSPIEAATKDPALDIRHMLSRIALACAPAGTEISVTVDRFTDFDVALVLHQPLSLTQIAELTKAFLKSSVPYVHSFRIIQGNEILALLNQAAIESVPNLKLASTDSIQALLLTSENEPTPASVADNGSVPAPSEDDVSPDQIKINEAQSAFKTLYDEHVRRLKKLVLDLDAATQLDTIKSRDQLNAQIKSLDKLSVRISDEREFFLHQSADFGELLTAQKLDPLLIIILKRGLQDPDKDQIFSNLFDSLSAYQKQIKTFLTGMEKCWGEWATDAGTHRIQFSTSAAQSTYSLGINPVRSSAEKVQSNFQSWANYRPAK